MIEKIQAGGFTDEVQAEKEELARNVAGLAYGGEYMKLHNCFSLTSETFV